LADTPSDETVVTDGIKIGTRGMLLRDIAAAAKFRTFSLPKPAPATVAAIPGTYNSSAELSAKIFKSSSLWGEVSLRQKYRNALPGSASKTFRSV